MGGDNVAIACRRLERGTIVAVGDKTFALDYTVLEGHRFAVARIAQGASLLSWGLPFGYALRDIGTPCSLTRSILTARSLHTLTEAIFSVWPAEGTYVINQGVLEALHGRHLDFELPHEPNFYDEIPQYELNRETFVPTPAVRDVSALGFTSFVNSLFRSVLTRAWGGPRAQLPRIEEERSFMGYERPAGRGVGTRNCIIVLSTNSQTGTTVSSSSPCTGLKTLK